MAIFKPSPIVQSISGRLGSLVFVQSKRRAIIRTAPSITNKASDIQVLRRCEFARLANIWRTLSDDQRTQWRAGAEVYQRLSRLGLHRRLSGSGLFHFVNRASTNHTVELALTPPNFAFSRGYDRWDLSAVKVSDFTWATVGFPLPQFPNMREVWSARSYQAKDLNFLPNWKLIHRAVAAFDPAIRLGFDWRNVFGDPILGETVLFRIRVTHQDSFGFPINFPSTILQAKTIMPP